MRFVLKCALLCAVIVGTSLYGQVPSGGDAGSQTATKEPASPAIGADEPSLSFGLYGKPSGHRTTITLMMGNNITRAVKVFSEPSHTLMVAFADTAEKDPRQAAWYRALPTGGRMLIPFAPGSRANFEAEAVPRSDTHIQVSVFGRFPGEREPQERTYTGYVNPRKFGFSFRELGIQAIICCEKDPDHPGGYCTSGCARCPAGTSSFSCCVTNTEQEQCGWCNKERAYCELVTCPGCG